jgi:hypothetical protein
MSYSSHSAGRISIAQDLFTEDLVVHLLQAEEALRKSYAVQELYRAVRDHQAQGILPREMLHAEHALGGLQSSYWHRRSQTYVLEDDLQRLILRQHGVQDVLLRLRAHSAQAVHVSSADLESSASRCWGQLYLSDPDAKDIRNVEKHLHSDALLEQYRHALQHFVHLPRVKQAAFYLRNNIMVPGYQVGDNVDPNIPLFTYSVDGNLDSKNTLCTIGDLFRKALAAGKQRLVLLAGSIT